MDIPFFQRHRLSRVHRRLNLVYPKSKNDDQHRVTEFRITMTKQQPNKEDDEDVVCGIDTSTTISEETFPRYKTPVHLEKSVKSVAIQTIIGQPLRLRVLPSVKDIVHENETNSADVKGFSKIWKYIRFLGRLSLSLFGLFWFLITWAIVGAIVFCAIEGPREREQVTILKDLQNDLSVSLATELRQLRTEKEEDLEPLWSVKVEKYVAKHEELLLRAVSSGYGESGNSGELWTLPGCILFSLSLLTTLGFGAPVPRTTIGRTVTVIFAAIGIPAHFLLIMNVGLLLAIRLQRYAISRKFDEYDQKDPKYLAPIPKWVKIVPFVFGEQDCRKTWALLRDSFRRAIKKQKKNSQANVTCKKWRYQDEMSFLIPFMKERSTLCILTPQTDEHDDYEVNLDSESSIPSLDYTSDRVSTDNNPFNLSTATAVVRSTKCQRNNSFKNLSSEETLMKYVLDNKRNCDDIEQFFASMATTVKSFPPRERAVAKAKVFELISKMEIDILSNPSTSDNKPTMPF
ncbi:uncharacterized protein LOC117602439 isoform X2 [Osmia lignaria lignaria]|uniref:uncharacterized protein LOC117602439 isoform X2 n=1 Tax=Osmia lignaria lignaria TaxID=1437193 RepID=UPI00402B732B